MKSRNKFEVLTIVILFIAASIICGNGLQAKSIKKTFKYIKEGEIAKADTEVQEFKGDQKTSVEYLMLPGLSSCMIIC
jgi:acid phosphatase family membrane protein YuiD